MVFYTISLSYSSSCSIQRDLVLNQTALNNETVLNEILLEFATMYHINIQYLQQEKDNILLQRNYLLSLL